MNINPGLRFQGYRRDPERDPEPAAILAPWRARAFRPMAPAHRAKLSAAQQRRRAREREART